MAGVAHYVPGLLLAYAICALGILSPGPNVLTVMGTSMTEGRRLGRATAWGISSGSFLWALLTWAGLVAVIAAYASVLIAVKLYLLWLAFKAFRSAASANEPIAGTFAAARTKRAFFLRGLTIQMTNPKAAFSWISIMSLGLEANAPLWVGLAIVFRTTLISIVGHQIYAVAFSTEPMINAYRRGRRWIQAGLGTFFCMASYKLMTAKT